MSNARNVCGALVAAWVCLVAEAQFGELGSVTQWYWEVAPGSSGKAGEQVELVIKADVAPGWIVYSSDFKIDGVGPIAAKLALDDNGAFSASGALRAVGSQPAVEKIGTSEFAYTYFSEHAEFRQRVLLLQDASAITGTFSGQTCYKPTGLCTLFREKFSAAIR